MNYLTKLLSTLRNEKGQGMVEYALIIAFVAIAVIITLTAFGQDIVAQFQAIVDAI